MKIICFSRLKLNPEKSWKKILEGKLIYAKYTWRSKYKIFK